MGTALNGSVSQVRQQQIQQLAGTFVGRISSVRSGNVYVVIPTYDLDREFGPCVIPIGVQGVGPATANVTTGAVTMSNGTALIQGLQVVVLLPSSGSPWLMAIAPTGPGV